MNKRTIFRFLLSALIIIISAGRADALDYPHTTLNNIGCDSCHFIYGDEPSLLPPWTSHVPLDIDDTQFNTLCWSCHNDLDAPYMRTHSSLQIDNSYGDWTVECKVCHNPHYQRQFRIYGSASYLYSGASTSVNETTITKTDAGWTDNQYQGLVVVPNISKRDYNYKIISNTGDTLTVVGPMDLTKVSSGNTFAIVYGRLIKDSMDLSKITPPKSGSKTTRFFNSTGSKSFADGDATYDGVCEVCHTQTTHFRNNGGGSDQLHSNMGSPAGTRCTSCHQHINGFRGMGGGAHSTHVLEGYGPLLTCADCHGANVPPLLADGQNLANTTVCNNCHSASGAAIAKQYWSIAGSSEGEAGSWAMVESEAVYCGSCHDATPGNTKKDGTGDTAPNVMGNGATYGYSISGHGKATGSYQRLSWQDTTATGNPAANRQCSACHNLTSQHFNNSDKRLKTGYENDNNNNCKQCHDPGAAATADPRWYTTYTAYESSAHKAVGNLKCTACHDVHGASGAYPGMTKLNQESLCNQGSCHSGIGGHPGVGSTTFTINSKNYTLECVSCHNVHLVTGTYAQAAQDKSPVTKFSENTLVWGDDWNEKMDFYAGSGTYRTPIGESFTDAQLPDYPSFCLDCHGTGGANHTDYEPSPYFRITWDGDAHGRQSANEPNGYGVCPNWFACGLASGWENDDCVAADKNDCWPVITRGKGDELFSRNPYNHEERIAGANFTLSCTDCHTGHGSGTLGRPNVNGGSFSSIWNTMCNNCHYYYSDWHAGMACGNASCHEQNSIHRGKKMSGSGGTRTFNPGLVLDMRFENNLKDSGTWQMDGKWYSTEGSFTTGKSGQAALLGEDIGVQVGTENSNWSTDEGYHGTWKYTEMKYNTSLEAWVYPTDNAKSEYTIFNKHVGVSNNGSYTFTLKKINGTLRAVFNMAADNNGVAQDGRAGVRGAYSSVAAPLNKWTHVAATFDKNGPNRNPADPSVGRIRIYVNGEDVTTSDSSGNNMQPGVNETSIYAFSENSGWNEAGVCYADSWCASEFSIGGFDWEATNFIGRIDEARVWNITKDATYFSSYDSQAGPYISHVEGLIGSNQLTVRFSEGVYTNTGSSGALVPADFVLTDTGGNNPRSITGVTHTAGSSTAVITMSAPLNVADVNADTLSAAGNAIYDNYNLAAGTEAVTIGLSSQCPTSPVSMQLNEVSGSTYVMDTQSILYGAVYGGADALTGSAYSGGGDGSGRYIMFDYNTSCLQASTAMTVEARIKPTGLSTVTGDTQYVRRILARDGSGNYQISVWRNNTWNNPTTDTYNAPDGQASIALWIYVADAHGGNVWKPVLTNYQGAKTGSENDCPIVSDHWYQVKAVWNSNKPGGAPGQFFTPADVYIDDQGTDGAGAGENWSGYINCTDTDQSLKFDAVKFYTADEIKPANGNFAVGANRGNPANNLFNGLIDWITWKDSVD
ncbi:MAG: hypothetical protein HZA14_13320 [Nitrospirae bacterium]|nr:hypothetical protein [Nitrospirota bacterium]